MWHAITSVAVCYTQRATGYAEGAHLLKAHAWIRIATDTRVGILRPDGVELIFCAFDSQKSDMPASVRNSFSGSKATPATRGRQATAALRP